VYKCTTVYPSAIHPAAAGLKVSVSQRRVWRNCIIEKIIIIYIRETKAVSLQEN
jgi:hypothetical protein